MVSGDETFPASLLLVSSYLSKLCCSKCILLYPQSYRYMSICIYTLIHNDIYIYITRIIIRIYNYRYIYIII